MNQDKGTALSYNVLEYIDRYAEQLQGLQRSDKLVMLECSSVSPNVKGPGDLSMAKCL